MNPLKALVVSLVLASMFAGSQARADDCSDTPIAESCACFSGASSQRGQVRSSRSKVRKSASTKIAQRTKRMLAPSNNR